MEYIKRYYKVILVGIVLLLLLIFSVYYALNNVKEEDDIVNESVKEKEITYDDNYYYIDVKGEVKNPGVYKLKEGKRIIDALNLAGGITENADTTNINLSKKITDEMCITVLSKNDNQEKNNTPDKKSKVSINTGTLEDLQSLSGIGESKANAIIKYREENGLFSQIEDVKNVPGIGESLYEKIKNSIEI